MVFHQPLVTDAASYKIYTATELQMPLRRLFFLLHTMEDNDSSVRTSELGEYVKKRVSQLTNNKQTPNTRRVNLEGDFTLATTK